MKICFVLPGYTRQPIGGFKIVYEYANQLISRGHQVSLLCINKNIMGKYHLPRILKKLAANYFTKHEPKWFDLNPAVKKISCTSWMYKRKLDDYDIVIATSVDSVSYVMESFCDKPKAYLIQDFENWKYDDDYCYRTYSMPMLNIVVSSWLKTIVEPYSLVKPIVIKNPIDLSSYRVIVPPDSRKVHTIGFLYHAMEHKGVVYSIEAMHKLKQLFPDLDVYTFGVPEKPSDLPEWVHYTQCATKEETIDIYNKVSVWICTSIKEGFGLTGLEAMACGAALASSAYTGALEYAKDGYNAYLSPIKDTEALVKNVCTLFNNDAERYRIIDNGISSVKEFSYDMAAQKMETALQEYISKKNPKV